MIPLFFLFHFYNILEGSNYTNGFLLNILFLNNSKRIYNYLKIRIFLHSKGKDILSKIKYFPWVGWQISQSSGSQAQMHIRITSKNYDA